jgi:NADH-quinone oxidoreductase subunit J
MVEAIVFAVSAVVILGGALGVILSRNTVHSALSLVATLFGVAVLFVAQEANFLAAVQVIVYAGAIVVLFLFVIMLLGVDNADDLESEPLVGQRPAALAIGFLLAAGLVAVVVTSTVTGIPSASAEWVRDGDDIAQIGRLLFTDYLFAFEITALLLVIAVVGAVLLARTKAGGQVDDEEPVAVLPGEVLVEDEVDEEADA